MHSREQYRINRVSIRFDGDNLQGSYGQITTHKMINARTLKPEPYGFFAQEIFGPYVTNECACGKYSGVKNIGQKCDQCKVEITSSRVSRYRGAHILLNVMVINPLAFRGLSSRLSRISGFSTKELEDIIYYRCYVVTASGFSSSSTVGKVINEEDENSFSKSILLEMLDSGKFSKDPKTTKKIQKLLESLSIDRTKRVDPENLIMYFFEDYLKFFREKFGLVVENGAKSLHKILSRINFESEFEKLKKYREENKQISNSQLTDILDRMRTLRAFIKNKFRVDSIFFTKLPVIPSGLRPAVKLVEESSIVTSSLNNLYRTIFIVNQRISDLMQSETFFEKIINMERVQLQISIDRLFHGNETSGKETNAPKSISQILGGKGGILRRECLGKRVDYSARSVIVPNPRLKLHQFGLPVVMALTLFFPFIQAKLMKDGYASNVKSAKEIIDQRNPIIFPILKEIVRDHPCVLNRAPTLHRLGMQGFFPVLVKGLSIQLHPLAVPGFNADFDGDQVLVAIPLKKESIAEVKELMLSTANIINPQNQLIITKLTQDALLGIYWLTKQIRSDENVPIYLTVEDLKFDYESGRRALQDIVMVPASLLRKQFVDTVDTYVFTTLGKIIFNEILPDSFKYFLNELDGYTVKNGEQLSKKYIVSPSKEQTRELSREFFDKLYHQFPDFSDGWRKKDFNSFTDGLLKICQYDEIVKFLDDAKDLGFHYSEISGVTISPFEISELQTKKSLVEEAKKEIEDVENHLSLGFYNSEEAYQKRLAIWANCKDKIEKELLEKLKEDKNSSIYTIWSSGARSNIENLMQIFGMVGNVVDFRGVIQEFPIISSLVEGLNPHEFLTSVSGAMKGMIDTSVNTANAGYYARKIMEAIQSLIVKIKDCGTKKGSKFRKLKEVSGSLLKTLSSKVVVPFADMIRGRFTLNDVLDANNELLIAKDTLILDKEIEILENHNIEEIYVRSVTECQVASGVCQKCYGSDLSKQDLVVEKGVPVGIIAAQSLSEPGTQLTMRTFHTGGVSGKVDIVQGLPFVNELMDNISPDKDSKAFIAKATGEITKVSFDQETKIHTVVQKDSSGFEHVYSIPSNREITVVEGDLVETGQKISSGKVDISQFLEYTDRESFREYATVSILKVYLDQGILINSKHVELFVKQMLSKVEVIDDDGGSHYLIGDILDYVDVERITTESHGKIRVKQVVLGVKKVVNHLGSFLAGISFQNTYKSLLEYAIFQPNDYLIGLKENVIIGQLIPAGTTFDPRRAEDEEERRKKARLF